MGVAPSRNFDASALSAITVGVSWEKRVARDTSEVSYVASETTPRSGIRHGIHPGLQRCAPIDPNMDSPRSRESSPPQPFDRSQPATPVETEYKTPADSPASARGRRHGRADG